ncbi:hypothetical protein JZ751_008651 [Albula glossodonta]|uniref:Uncharacterized protein n=1 Tax=Albula glossodonta TaxID=121402 RepID=A0A8T2PA05_9TELE|nr:hypothetical protein JZ751_008651 [Albula glossodonta]
MLEVELESEPPESSLHRPTINTAGQWAPQCKCNTMVVQDFPVFDSTTDWTEVHPSTSGFVSDLDALYLKSPSELRQTARGFTIRKRRYSCGKIQQGVQPTEPVKANTVPGQPTLGSLTCERQSSPELWHLLLLL